MTVVLFILLSCPSNSFGQLTASGIETIVNTTITNHQQRPAVSMNKNGDYVVVWESLGQDGDGYGIFAQAYNSTGVAQTSEFLVNTTVSNDQRFPAIAMDEDGDFVIVWQSYNEDGDSWGIYMQRYNDNYSTEGSQTLVNSTITGRQSCPKVAMDV